MRGLAQINLNLKKLIFVIFFSVTGCGANLDSASDVKNLFDSPPKSLGAIAGSICSDLGKRNQPPITSSMTLQIGDCKDAGRRALGLDQVTAFQFTDVTPGTTSSEDNERVFSKSLRTQLWLNHQIADLIPIFTILLKSGVPHKGPITLPDTVANFEGIVKPVITLVEDPKFNLDDASFAVPIHVKATGVVSVDLDIFVNGKVYGDGIAVTITTGRPEPSYKRSLVKSFEIFVFVVPYAKDIYVDMSAGFKMYDIGVGGLLDKELNTVAGSVLKTILDTVMNVGGGK